MTFDQEPPDEADYRLVQESDERDAAEAAFVDGYAKAGASLSSDERDVAAQAWFHAWCAGAAFEREWVATHQPSDPHLTGCPRCDLSDALAAHNGAGDCPPGSNVREPARCTHEGGEWPGLDRCADCGQPLGSSEREASEGEGYPCSVDGRPCPCGFDSEDCR